jgi:hypothetical protein
MPPASPPRLLVCGLHPCAPSEKLERVRESLTAQLALPETAADANLKEWIEYYLRDIHWCIEQRDAEAIVRKK